MKKPLIILIVNITLLSILIGCNSKPLVIITCGDDQVFLIDYETSDTNNLNILWQWNAKEATDLPVIYQEYMRGIDDCKPVDDNTKILIVSSGGGVVLVDRETKQSLFYAHVPNAHSAEWLPNNRIVVALSTSPGGNSIEVYDVNKSDVVLFKDSLYSGHGVVWIPKTEQLFALGNSELRAYSLKKWDTEKPELQLEKSWTIPGISGHDLISVSDNRLILTAVDGVWNFDIPNEEFSPFSPLESVRNVKSINYDETTERLIYTKAEISWWTHHIYCKNPDRIIAVPNNNLYKVRIIPE
jgi:hypothetical protein